MTQSQPTGAIAAGHEVSAQAGARMLQLGGNAFDAILAALFASCVCEPVLSSPGGGGFLMAHEAKTSRTRLFDFFVQTPHKKRACEHIEFKPIYADFGTTRQKFQIGMGASATPGFIPGCFEIHQTLCTLPLADILQPAIEAAQNGVVMDGFQSRLFKIVEPILLDNDNTRALFAPQGNLLVKGDIFNNPQLAETFKRLAGEGLDFFNNGAVRDCIVELAEHGGGHLSAEDFSSYETIQREALVQPFGEGGEVFFNPVPSAGGCLIGLGLSLSERLVNAGAKPDGCMVAKILQAIDHTRQDFFEDPDLMLSEDNIASAVTRLKTQTITAKGTTHISIIDAEGNAASATVSNGEGNGNMVGDFGFMLNNMLGEEDLNPAGFHQWRCNVRLSSMMAPTLVRHGNGALSVLGSGGANRIRSAMLQVLLHIKAGVSAADAVNAARLHYEAGKLDMEGWFDGEVLTTLLATYRETRVWDQPNMFFGGVHMVHKTAEGGFEGAGDKRRDGCFIAVYRS